MNYRYALIRIAGLSRVSRSSKVEMSGANNLTLIWLNTPRKSTSICNHSIDRSDTILLLGSLLFSLILLALFLT